MKTKIKINVPSGIKYISEWKDYELPQGHSIVDKGVTGCGYTEYCLTNKDNVVLCSPRKLLLENKRDQHLGELNIKYMENKIEDFDGVRTFESMVKEHAILCREDYGLPVKMMVTYDSCFRVVRALEELGILDEFTFVVDEFQSIFLDAYYKAHTEFDFVDNLQGCKNVLYLSATPMLDKYLVKVQEFKDLPFYEIIWPDDVVEKIVVKRKRTDSLGKECQQIIQEYLDGKYPKKFLGNSLYFSKEAVFYFNSITEIVRVITKKKLTPDNTVVICANTPENAKKLKRIGFDIGKIPLRDEPSKMFTFCTSTAYIGADFYSKSASTYIFADPNLDHLALDISLDLPQIAGRQRLRENVFKNDIVIFYKILRGDKKITREAFDKKQESRREMSGHLLNGFTKLSDEEKKAYVYKLKDSIQVSLYSRDFVSVSKTTGAPVYNDFIELSNERAWDVAQEDYQDSISVTRALDSISSELGEYRDEVEKLVQDFLDNKFYSTNRFSQKLRYYCEFMDSQANSEALSKIEEMIFFRIKDERFRMFYRMFGTSGCSSAGYKENILEARLYNYTKEDSFSQAIRNTFKVGDKLTRKDIKSKLALIIRDLGMTMTAKASILSEYFNLIPITITVNGKRENGYRLESKYKI